MVYKAKHSHTYKLRVSIPGGGAATCSTGTTDKRTAQDVEAMVTRLKRQRKWEPLEAIVSKRLTLAQVFDADVRGTLDALVASLKDIDLEPYVAEWAKRANAKYVRQVRVFMPDGQRYPASQFRRATVSAFLAGLTCADPTKNRYRAALSMYARWLVEREIIPFNPVRDVAAYKEREPRMVWMTWKDAQRVADAAPQPYRALFALMAGSGIELGAALALTVADVDEAAGTVHARGSKTPWRNRVVRPEPWAMLALSQYRKAAGILSGKLFDLPRHRPILAAFRAAQQAVGLSGHRLHDLRHSYAVNALKKGYKPQVVAHQLGHRDSTMVSRVYGRFIPDAADYAISESPAAFSAATVHKSGEA